MEKFIERPTGAKGKRREGKGMRETRKENGAGRQQGGQIETQGGKRDWGNVASEKEKV